MMAILENVPVSTANLLVWINNQQNLAYGDGDFGQGYLEALSWMSKLIRSL